MKTCLSPLLNPCSLFKLFLLFSVFGLWGCVKNSSFPNPIPPPLTGTGPAFDSLADITLHNGAAYVADSGLGAVLQVNLSTGDRSFSSKAGDSGRGTGPAFSNLAGIAFYNGAAYVADSGLGAVLQVNLSTGDRSLSSKAGASGRGTGPAFSNLAGIAFYNGAAYVADSGLGALLQVNLSTGDRSFSSKAAKAGDSGRGSGPAFSNLAGIAFYNGAAYVADSGLGAVLQVNLSTGDRSLSSKAAKAGASGRGTGVAFSNLAGIAFYNGAAYVTDSGLRALLQVNLSTGNRTVASGDVVVDKLPKYIGNGPYFKQPSGLALTNGAAYVVGKGHWAVWRVNLATGYRTIFSK